MCVLLLIAFMQTTPTSSDADMERLRNRVAQLQNDSTELTALRRREAEMATALASSQVTLHCHVCCLLVSVKAGICRATKSSR